MQVRDAVEGDAAAIARLANLSEDAARRLLRERSVLVASDGGAERAAAPDDGSDVTGDGGDQADTGDGDGADLAEVTGCLAYDATTDAVHVTTLAGDREAFESLLAEPLRFADGEELPVEVVVPVSERATQSHLADLDFREAGDGPRFDGEATIRLRRSPE